MATGREIGAILLAHVGTTLHFSHYAS